MEHRQRPRRARLASRPTRDATGTGSSTFDGDGRRASSMDVQEDGGLRARLRAQAQLLRPRRRHRARRRDPAPALRAPRGAGGRRHERARTASSAPARTSTCSARSTHAFKVNFCKFTNETRLALEDASRAQRACSYARGAERHRRRRRLRARARLRRDPARRRRQLGGEPPRGAAPRRAARHRRPHPPRRQAQGAPRPRRRVLARLAEGVKGKRAVRVGPRRRGRARARSSPTRVARARAGAGRDGADAQAGPGVALAPLERRRTGERASSYRYVDARASTRGRASRRSPCARPRRASPTDAGGHARARAATLWALRAFRELDDALLAPALQPPGDRRRRCCKTARRRRARARRRRGARRAPATTGSCARSLLHMKRVLQAPRPHRAQRSSRSSSRARASPARCSSSRSPPTALHARRRDERPTVARSAAQRRRAARCRTACRASQTRFLGEPERVDELLAHERRSTTPDGARRRASSPFAPDEHRLGRRAAPRHRGARQPLARRAHRHGGEPALRRPRDAWRPRSSAASRPGRTGSSSARTPSASAARSRSTASPSAPEFDWRRT